jgi:UDP-N-acetylglucosamine 2-epimerase (non-hydrolysing)
MHILHTVGARPNFMKAGPVLKALADRKSVRQTVVHTGQHYDANMSKVFFQELGIAEPEVNLEVGSGSHAQQTAAIMSRFEPVVLDRRPDLVLVYGDVNSTLAAALVCAKLMVPVGHVEAGLRSYDRTMPEEINRVLADQVADLLFTPTENAEGNLLREGVPKEGIHFVGNVMIDTLVRLLPKALKHFDRYRSIVAGKPYGLVTLHRPPNVDDPATLASILSALDEISSEVALLFPVHPRTRQRLESHGAARNAGLHLLEPLGYLDNLALQRNAAFVITDSGGIQEESTFLGVPCLTVRENTERPVTVALGTNTLVGRDMERLKAEVQAILAGKGKKGQIPPSWDGHAAERIADVIMAWKGPE